MDNSIHASADGLSIRLVCGNQLLRGKVYSPLTRPRLYFSGSVWSSDAVMGPVKPDKDKHFQKWFVGWV